MRHILLLLCSLLVFTNAMSEENFSEYLAAEWGVELSTNIEEVTSQHITADDIQTAETSDCRMLCCVYAPVTDDDKSPYNSYRQHSVVKSQTGDIPHVRDAIPDSSNHNTDCTAYASYNSVDAAQKHLVRGIASCAADADNRMHMAKLTNASACVFTELGNAVATLENGRRKTTERGDGKRKSMVSNFDTLNSTALSLFISETKRAMASATGNCANGDANKEQIIASEKRLDELLEHQHFHRREWGDPQRIA